MNFITIKTIKSKYNPVAIIVVIIIALFALSLFATTAAAHGPEILAEASPPDGAVLPKSPSQITMVFTAALKTEPHILEVYDLDGNRVDNEDTQIDSSDAQRPVMMVNLPTLDEGVYMVRWSVSPMDGDVVNGLHFFSVGALPDDAAGQLSSRQNAPDPAPTEQNAADQTSTINENNEPWSLLIMIGGAIMLSIIGIGIYFGRTRWVSNDIS